jgi:hypothetical protein
MTSIEETRANLVRLAAEFVREAGHAHPFETIEAVRRQEFAATNDQTSTKGDLGLGSAVELAAMLWSTPPQTHSDSANYVDIGPQVAPELSRILHDLLG